jgi:hypothetical protein
MTHGEPICPITELARMLDMDPREIIRDLGEREAAMFAEMNARFDVNEACKPTPFLPLKGRNGEFGTVGASIPETIFGNLLARGPGYGLMDMLNAQDLSAVHEEFPCTKTETVSGRVQSGYTGRGGRWGSRRRVRFDTNINFAR